MTAAASVRGAAKNRTGATDTTMLIWKVIDANPGITREEIFAKVEQGIPAGWAKRRYAVGRNKQDVEVEALSSTRARSYILSETLLTMRRWQSIARDEVGRYRTLRPLENYHGDPSKIDHTGTRAAEHLTEAYALRTAEKFLASIPSEVLLDPRGRVRPTAADLAAMVQVVRGARRRIPERLS